MIIDDLGYHPKGADESEVLFTLIGERYKRRSPVITSTFSSLSGRRCLPIPWLLLR